MKTIIHKSETRGHANHGWLDTYHTFSFAGYYDPDRIHFGALRVLNDDTIKAGTGFGTHPHDNMEIVTIVLDGALEHQDSMGNISVINRDEIQAMSAGTGIQHSEYSKNTGIPTRLLQIWVIPDKENVTPRYDQMTLDAKNRHNNLQQIISPDTNDEGLWIHQSAWFHIGKFDKNASADYHVKQPGNGVYAFVISGSFSVEGQVLGQRDGMGITGTEVINLSSLADDSEILLMDLPMKV